MFADFPHDGRVYLVKRLSPTAGFYVCDGNPIYAAQIEEPSGSRGGVKTECLHLKLAARLRVIEGGDLWKPCFLDMIRLVKYSSDREFTAFVDLCEMHAKGSTSLSFEDFFYSINDLFQSVRHQRTLDALGLFGELVLIDALQQLLPGRDISAHWQILGSSSKYDLTFDFGNIEVKTTTISKLDVHIKHSQIFNNDTNYLAVVLVERVPGGETLSSLADRLSKSEGCFTDLRSQTELTKRLLKVGKESLEIPYAVREVRCYESQAISPFETIPERVTELNYRLDLAEVATVAIDQVASHVALGV